ncbi:MAG: hypothetical protein AAB692_01700 [Patescibacteria group bacterium]|mgnify:CR=1 FL=1
MPALISVGDIIVRSLEVYKKNFRIFGDFAVWFGVLGLVQWAFAIFTESLVPDRVAAALISRLISIPIGLVLLALLASMIDVTAQAIQKKSISLDGMIVGGIHKLLPFLWVMALTTAAVFGGLLLLVIPALIFFVWYRFAAYFTVIDDVRGWKALKASKKIVADRFWSVVLRLALPWLFFYVLFTFAIGVLYLLLGAGLGDVGLFFGNAGNRLSISAPQSLILMVVPQAISGLMLPLFIAADLHLWFDLKRTA